MRARFAIVLSAALTMAGAASAQTLSNPPGADQPPAVQPGPPAEPPPPQNPDTACMPPSASGSSRLHVEVRDEHGLYRGDETVLVTGMDGKPVVSATCSAPFANFRLAPGCYGVSAFIGDRLTNVASVEVTRSGANAVLAFPPEPSRNDEVL